MAKVQWLRQANRCRSSDAHCKFKNEEGAWNQAPSSFRRRVGGKNLSRGSFKNGGLGFVECLHPRPQRPVPAIGVEYPDVRFLAGYPGSGQSASVKSFGCRQAYESPRGRNPRAAVGGYGDFDLRLMSAMARPRPGSGVMDAERPRRCASARFSRPGSRLVTARPGRCRRPRSRRARLSRRARSLPA